MGFESWRESPKRWWLVAGAALVPVGVAWLYRQIDVEAVHRHTDQWNAWAVFAAMVVLPLVGFPVSVVHAVAGLRFGLGWGLVLVAVATLLQLFAAHGLVRLAPSFFARRMAGWRKRVPKGAHTPVTLFTMLLPGVPYFGQIYVLPVIGVPLWTYVLWSWPINTARSVAGVAFGDVFDNLSPWKLAGFAAYFVVVGVTCAWAFRRLRRTMREDRARDGKGEEREVVRR